MKKVLSIMLTFVMLASLVLAGCSSSDQTGTTGTTSRSTEEDGSESGGEGTPNEDEEPYNVKIVLPYIGTEIGDLELVEAEINKIALERVNCTVTLFPVSFSEVGAKFSLWVANGEKVDLVSTFGVDYTSSIESNSIVRLDDMLEEHAPYLSSLDERYLGTRYNGGIYRIPIMQSAYGETGGICVRTDIMREVGLDYESYDRVTPEQLDEMFALVHEKYPDMITYGITTNIKSSNAAGFINMESFSIDGPVAGVLLMNGESDSTEILNLFETDEYREYLEWRRRWNQAGYISPDAATTTDSGSDWIRAGRSFSCGAIAQPGEAENMTKQTGYELTLLYQTDPIVRCDTYSAAPWVVPITSERPEKALEFLDLLYESKEVANLIQHGIEGIHYEKTDDDMIIDLYDDRAYKNDFGLYGNKLNIYLSVPATSEVFADYQVYNEKALENQSLAIGYKFVAESVTTEIASLTNVFHEYLSGLEYGSVDIDTVLPKFQQALRDAGIEKVIAENQRQFDEFLESQK